MVFAATVSSLMELPRQVKYTKEKARRIDLINILKLILNIFLTLLRLKIFFVLNSNFVIFLKAKTQIIYFDDKLKVYLSTILFDDWLEITTEKIIKILLSNK